VRRRARLDGNHPEIVAALRQVGAAVESLAPMGRGVPDLLVGWRGKVVLLEVKRPGEALTPDEARWHRLWADQPVVIVRSPEEALAAIGLTVA
jgi:hypothetical protein